MRKCFLLLALAGGLSLFARQPAHEAPSQRVEAEDESAGLMKWKLINTGIFFVLLGFGVIKLAPKFFQARSLDIQKAIKDATGLKIDADFRYSEIDKKMANLAGEVSRLRDAGDEEMRREHERVQRDTANEMEHLGRNADYEIESLRSEGALQVKRHTAQLAFAMAERRLQSHFAQNDGRDNITEFINLVGSGKSGGKN